jgi:hypothetical protein
MAKLMKQMGKGKLPALPPQLAAGAGAEGDPGARRSRRKRRAKAGRR